MKVAILGASGFVGSRLFELWQRPGEIWPRAVVRTPSGLARSSRFAADWRIADARDTAALAKAFEGCEAVVHCVMSDERTIAATIEPVYRAAAAAGVRRIVFLSTAVVHGQNPAPGTTEDSPLRDDQPLWYNNAKVRAERRLRQLAADGKVEIVVLRPGIVFGPRSRWVLDVAEGLRAGRAYWIDGGRGVCHSIFVDNLAYAVERAIAVPAANGEAFIVGDAEHVTWRDFYLGLALPLGYGESAFHEATPTAPPPRTWRGRLDGLRVSQFAQGLLARIPGRAKNSVKAALRAWSTPPSADPWALPSGRAQLVASFEQTDLFRCTVKLSHAKAERVLGYQPPVSFAVALRQCTDWLDLLDFRRPDEDDGGRQ